MRRLLRFRNEGVQNFWFNGTLPATLSVAGINTPHQHLRALCQLPVLTPHQHLRALTDELASEGSKAGHTTKGRRLLTLLQSHIADVLTPPPILPPALPALSDAQRVNMDEQRVINETPILTIPRITDAPAIMESRNPTAKRQIKTTPTIHRRQTRGNTPGGVPLIQRVA
jgi:hypothetical protein